VTPTTQGGAKFILDFNGYTLDCGENYICLTNAGDELTFKDTSGNDKPGGLKAIGFDEGTGGKFIFDSGRYKIGNYTTAEEMNAMFAANDSYEMADGKTFVDIANGPDTDDFNLTVGYATFELTIGAGRFATFFENNNIELIEPTEGVKLYTITEINGDRTEATIKELTGVVEAETPMLVYNSTTNPVTAKLKGTNAEANEANEDVTIAEEFMGTDGPETFTDVDMAEADYYALSGGKLFVPVYEPGTLGAHQCYLWFYYGSGDTTEPGAPARGITLVFEKSEATDITTTDVTDETDGAWYDLSGRKLDGEPTTKGVYVKDGKKVIIK
jgi:hypothetical protein